MRHRCQKTCYERLEERRVRSFSAARNRTHRRRSRHRRASQIVTATGARHGEHAFSRDAVYDCGLVGGSKFVCVRVRVRVRVRVSVSHAAIRRRVVPRSLSCGHARSVQAAFASRGDDRASRWYRLFHFQCSMRTGPRWRIGASQRLILVP
jgi:hypothetical protein